MRQGRFPRLRWVRWGLFAVLVVLIVGTTGPRALDQASGWIRDEYERLPWYATRITALLSYLALSASTVYGLLLSTRLLDRVTHRPVSFTLHQDLAGIGVALGLVHAAVLLIDRSVPYTPVEVVVPFAGPYRPLWVGMGQLAMGLALLVMLSFYVRKRIGTRAWRTIHHLSFAAFAGATVHGLMAGSDTGADWIYAMYLTLTVVVVFLTTYRIVLAIGARGGERTASTPTGRATAASDRSTLSPAERSAS
jgi:DMSO/TMAO reductase YedYZ heme-binding membrane subunit